MAELKDKLNTDTSQGSKISRDKLDRILENRKIETEGSDEEKRINRAKSLANRWREGTFVPPATTPAALSSSTKFQMPENPTAQESGQDTTGSGFIDEINKEINKEVKKKQKSLDKMLKSPPKKQKPSGVEEAVKAGAYGATDELKDQRAKLIKQKYQIMEAYEGLRGRQEWGEVAQMFAQALTQYAAAKKGLETGVDMSGLKIAGVDWNKKIKQTTDDLERKLNDVREDLKSVDRKESAQVASADRKLEREEDKKDKKEMAGIMHSYALQLMNAKNAADKGRGEKPMTRKEAYSQLEKQQRDNEADADRVEDKVTKEVETLEELNEDTNVDEAKMEAGINASFSFLGRQLKEADRNAYRTTLDKQLKEANGTFTSDYSAALNTIKEMQRKASVHARSADKAAADVMELNRKIGNAPVSPGSPASGGKKQSPQAPDGPDGDVLVRNLQTGETGFIKKSKIKKALESKKYELAE